MADMSQVHFGPVLEEGVSQVTATNSVDLGTRRIFEGESYVYCYNAGGSQASPSYGVKLITGCSGYSVAVTALTDVANPCVGVVKHATLTTATYGWVMTKGFLNLETHANSTITGDYVNISLGLDGTFHEVNPLTDAVHVGTFAAVGYGLDVDTASGGSFYGFINTGF
jgi:hypothetical protein